MMKFDRCHRERERERERARERERERETFAKGNLILKAFGNDKMPALT